MLTLACLLQTGVFFGKAEGAVMGKLVSMGSFKRYGNAEREEDMRLFLLRMSRR